MRTTFGTKVAFVFAAALMGQQATAQEDTQWSIEGDFEIGVEAIMDADDPDDEVSDLFFSAELEVEFALSDRVKAFAELTLESVTDAERDRAFEDMGFYVGGLGLRFDLDPVSLSVGKLSPAFGSAWDTARGYFGADIAEDYENEEMIGVMAEVELGDGLLTLSAFYPDDTRLSDSLGTRRGRNDRSDGGVGNTGKLNNFALQYDHEFDATTLHFGLRHLDQGEEDSDENGVALGMTHAFDNGIEVIAEYARFTGWEGEDANAGIATIGASLTRGAFTYSAALSERRISDAPTDRLIALGVDYEFDNGMTLSAGFAHVREEEEETNAIALSLVVPLE